MRVEQSGVFKRRVKKLNVNEKKSLDNAVKAIIDDTEIGNLKIGDLSGIRVYKYKHKAQQHLLAYQIKDEGLILSLIALGTHENFYRDLKRQ